MRGAGVGDCHSMPNRAGSRACSVARVAIENTIVAVDKAIDALVYELYGLTEEEIRIVKGEQQ